MINEAISSILQQEAEAVRNIPITDGYEEAVTLIVKHVHELGGNLITSGMGKDRAGFLTAMLLTALDVPEETIMKDYMASNNHIDLRSLAYMARNLNTDAQETITVLLGANETWLDLAFHKIKKEYGSTDKYLSKGLHLTEKERDTLKDIILN